MPLAGRAQTGLLLDDALLVDCGAGVLTRLAEHGDYEALEAVLLTHHHTDHVADLMPLLKARWLAGADPLTVVGPPGTEALLSDLLDAHAYLRGRVAYRVREHGGDPDPVAGYDLRARETVHSMRCFAYRFGDALAFSGDGEADAGLAAFADGCSVLVHDCSFPDGVDVDNHPTASALGAALAGHAFGTVYLMHLYPHARGRRREMLDAVAAAYDGDVRFAADGRTVEL
jgi:ribonuclease BN (tRNA processing enzyme)